jgi:hypothetical protein
MHASFKQAVRHSTLNAAMLFVERGQGANVSPYLTCMGTVHAEAGRQDRGAQACT